MFYLCGCNDYTGRMCLYHQDVRPKGMAGVSAPSQQEIDRNRAKARAEIERLRIRRRQINERIAALGG